MNPNKKYVANNRQSLLLIMNLSDGNGQISIGFNSGYGLRNEGYFITNDTLLQSTLENDPRYNDAYRLAEIDNIPVAEYYIRPVPEPEPEITMPEITEPEDVETLNPKVFASLEKAKLWLNKNHQVPLYKLATRKTATDCYKELGYQLEFEEKIKK